MWFAYDGGHFWNGTATSNAKVKNVRANPDVALAMGTGTFPAVAEGKATVESRCLDHPIVMEHFRHKYDAWDVADEMVDGPRVLLRVSVHRSLFAG